MPEQVYFVEVIWVRMGRPYTTNYHVMMTDTETKRLRGVLLEAKERGDVSAFDILPLSELTFDFQEFIEEMRESHRGILTKFRKRWF